MRTGSERRRYGGSTVSPYSSHRSTALGRLAALADRPDHERLAARMSPAAKTPGTLVMLVVVGPDVAALVELDAELRRAAGFSGPRKPMREQHELAPGRSCSRARHLLRAEAAVRALLPLDAARSRAPSRCPLPSPTKRFVEDRVLARVRAEHRLRLLLAVVQLVGSSATAATGCRRRARRAARGRISSCSRLLQPWRMRGADAVGAGVAAADDDDVLALGGDVLAVREVRCRAGSSCSRCRNSIAKWMPFSSRPGDGQVARPAWRRRRARPRRTPSRSCSRRDVRADLGAGDEA